jgi:hypothetical protein
MAPKTRSVDSPHATPVDSPDPTSPRSSLVPARDTLALVLEQMELINARLDAQTANVTPPVAAAIAPVSRNAVTMRTANPRVTSSPWTSAHHLHHVPLPDTPFQPTDLSSRRHRRITSPPPVATRTRTARRLQCSATLPFLMAHLLPFLVGIPLLPCVVLTPAVAAVAPPLTRWSSAALPMKLPALIRTPSTGP